MAEKGALSLLAELEVSGMVTSRALIIDDPDFPFERWLALGEFFGEAKIRLSFYLGDWLNFGSSGVYGERYSQALAATGRSEHTLANYAWVCNKVPRSRRRDELDFGHHEAVAPLDPGDQRKWLAEAVRRGLGVHALRDEIRSAGLVQIRRQQVLPVDPTTPLATVTAVAAIGAALKTLDRVEAGEDVTRELPAARRQLENAGATIRAYVDASTLRDAVLKVLDGAAKKRGGYLIPAPLLDELRTLVSEGEK